jgi:hypothetical protein
VKTAGHTASQPTTPNPRPSATVLFYSGHHRSSYPRALLIGGREVLVEGIIQHEVCEDFATRRRKHVYICSVGKKLWEVVRLDDDTTTCQPLAR